MLQGGWRSKWCRGRILCDGFVLEQVDSVVPAELLLESGPAPLLGWALCWNPSCCLSSGGLDFLDMEVGAV